MNIKYLLFSLAILLGFSSSAFAQSGYVTSVIKSVGCVSVNTYVDIGAVAQCYVGKNSGNLYFVAIDSFKGGKLYMFANWGNPTGSPAGDIEVLRYNSVPSCEAGQIMNPSTGACENPLPFCEKPETINEMNQFKDACFDKGAGWSPDVSCSDASESLSMSCNPPPPESCEPGSPSFPGCLDDENKCDENSPNWNPEYGMCCSEENNWCDVPPPESCTMFSPNWPECAGDTDINPPTGGDLTDPDKPDGGGTGNPDPDRPEPDVEENNPDATKAIESMNKDMNKQLTSINNDLNKNHAENISHLGALKDSIDLNTDTIVDSSNHIKDAIESQTGTLTDIGNTNNKLLGSLNHLLNNGIGQLSGDLSDIEGAINTGLDDLEEGLNGELSAGDCVSFSCEGNAATCYLARKAWEESCESKDLSGVIGSGDELLNSLGDYNEQFTDEHGAYKGIYTDAEGSVSDLLKAYDESNGVNFDGQCPPPKHYDGGLFNFTIDLSPFCEMAYIIRACIMAAAAFGSFMMISKFI